MMAKLTAAGLFVLAATALARAAPEAPDAAPMRFYRVVSDDPRCAPNCPEWIAAEGKIAPGTAATFQNFIASLNGRRLPIFINSPGGSTDDAMAMGRLIRAKRLAVAVASTTIDACARANPGACGPTRGSADAYRAYCASACSFVLAGGVERYASPLSRIGVHQTVTYLTQTRIVQRYKIYYRVVGGQKKEISRAFIDEKRTQTTTTQSALPATENAIAAYLREQGITPDLEKIALSTPPSSVRWLTADEKQTTHLVTAWIDDRSPMISGSISNGLTGVATDAAPSATPVFTAHGEWPFALQVNERTVWLDADFVFRRGGGVVETILRTRYEGPAAKAVKPGDALSRKFSIELIPGGDEFPAVRTADDQSWRAVVPRASFCAVVDDGRILIGPSDGLATKIADADSDAGPDQPPIAIVAAKVVGMPALLEEACPPPIKPAPAPLPQVSRAKKARA
jgi:hypothetical protein